MAKGYVAFVLHAHLPYVRHPEYQTFLEERWLFEAITETYLPLILAMERLAGGGVPFRLTLSLSPTLIAMFEDELLQRRYLDFLANQMRLAESEVRRTARDRETNQLARLYAEMLMTTADAYERRYAGDLLAAFRRFQDAGSLELITAAATHGYLPLLRTEPWAVEAQLKVAATTFGRVMERAAQGVWLPECGYYAGLEEAVQQAGFRYFFVDTHGIANADLRPHYGIHAPVACPNGVAAFGRDPESSREVWSAESGYPGDPWYRDFYRDIGFDLDFSYVQPYVHDGHTRIHTGFKYYRVTGRTDEKALYDRQQALHRVAAHADDFVAKRRDALVRRAEEMDRPPLAVCPYDAELFGHWWFEGPLWLEAVLRRIALDPDLEAVTPSQYLSRHPTLQCTRPSPSSWGDKGYSAFWLNPGNDWIYPHLHHAARYMREIATRHRDAQPGSPVFRAAQQAARSLLLAQASDWTFIQKTGTNVEYAHARLRDNLARFHYLEEALRRDAVDDRHLTALEFLDNPFPDIDFRVYAG